MYMYLFGNLHLYACFYAQPPPPLEQNNNNNNKQDTKIENIIFLSHLQISLSYHHNQNYTLNSLLKHVVILMKYSTMVSEALENKTTRPQTVDELTYGQF